jgi:hypothetical protein
MDRPDWLVQNYHKLSQPLQDLLALRLRGVNALYNWLLAEEQVSIVSTAGMSIHQQHELAEASGLLQIYLAFAG